MYKKLLTLSALTLAITACGGGDKKDLQGNVNLSGSVEYDATLTANIVEPDGLKSQSSVSYSWHRDEDIIPGATGSTYTIQKQDLEARIRAQVKYVDDKGFNTVSVSERTEPVPIVNFPGMVIIEGTAQQGETLEAIPTDDNKGLDITGATFTWYADGVALSGQISRKLQLSRDEIGKTITVTTEYTDRHDFFESVTSEPTAEVIKINNTPGIVTLSGDKTSKTLLQVGQTLKINVEDFNGVGSAPTYSWYANDTLITGENQQTYTLVEADIGKTISAKAVYVDAEGFDEDITSAVTEAIIAKPAGTDNEPTVTYSVVTPTINTPIAVTIADDDGLPSDIFYQWSINGEVVSNANEYTPVAEDAGKELRLVADYTDNVGFISVVDEVIDTVFTKIVNNKTELQTTLSNLESGDVIGIAPGDYNFPDDAPAHIEVTQNNITLRRTAVAINAAESATNAEKAAITGKYCFSVNSSADGTSREDGVKLTHLLFSEFDRYQERGVACHDRGNSVFRFNGDYTTISHSYFLNDAITGLTPNEGHWFYVDSSDILIERNNFDGRNLAKVNLKGGLMKLESLDTPMNHIIQYNYFANYELGSNAGVGNESHLIRFGNAESNANRVGNITYRYNLSDKVDSRLYILRINSSGSKVYGNTFLDNRGGVSLQTGENGNVSYNIFLGDNTNDDQGGQAGVMASPHGHTVVNNYIVAINSAGTDRGALVLETNKQDNQANSGKRETKFINNTIINSKQGIIFGNQNKSKCTEWTGELPVYLGALQNNLVVSNFDAGADTNELISTAYDMGGAGALREGCFWDTHMKVSFENEHYYADTIVGDKKTFTPAGPGVVLDVAANAEVGVNAEGYAVYTGADTDVGADPSKLYRIQTNQVGVGSSWEWDILLPGLND